MSGFLQPSPAVLALLGLQSGLYLPILFMLAVCRVWAGPANARILAGLSAVIALLGIAAHFGPAVLNLYTGPLPQYASLVTKYHGGMALPLAASLPLLVSAFLPGRAWKWLDLAHMCLIAALVGLWGWTRYF
ncbi:hypothetical protein Q4577_04805 [Marinovum sp. 2_MG-2023]|uniref:hypothetical protein n=1 Tax=unclassified Marinovum TaxID=2647166 RepID=UPI0026E2A859|nr:MULTISPECIES: hypothetical protein [unclassified Marinovum]MDO6729328.1 hypothetical protein [Marinovum sp. 2_MG-2023]MDO6780457.1 hypothetical protein [Marinovum sp. 1_MG-2023]